MERPTDGLRRPRSDPIGKIEDIGVAGDRACIARQDAAETFEECGLARSVRTDQAEDFARMDGKGDGVQRREAAIALGQTRNLNHAPILSSNFSLLTSST